MGFPETVKIREVGPREGFQFEGINDPGRITLSDKVRLIDALSATGLRGIQIVSFVHPRRVPQMADAEEICRTISRSPTVSYTGTYMNDEGLKRALKTGVTEVMGKVALTASETFAGKNLNRSLKEDFEMQHKMARIYMDRGIPVTYGSIMAAFGCNYEGRIALERVLFLTDALIDLAKNYQSTLNTLMLADTMGWAHPEQIRATVKEIKSRWPDLHIGLHLHDTRGMGMANVYAALMEGIDDFDTAVGGLGGCPFAGFSGAAGNVCTEDVLQLCSELGIETGIDIDKMIACARMAEEIVGHPLPGRVKDTILKRGSSIS
jgi:hydroxymethylglutaryl-CoA lyase